MTEQILDLKEQAAAIDVVFKLEAECRKRGEEVQRQAVEIWNARDTISSLNCECRTRGLEIERQAAEILELQRRNENQAETIVRLRAELEMYQS